MPHMVSGVLMTSIQEQAASLHQRASVITVPSFSDPTRQPIAGASVESVAEDEIMRILILMRNFVQGAVHACACLPLL